VPLFRKKIKNLEIKIVVDAKQAKLKRKKSNNIDEDDEESESEKGT